MFFFIGILCFLEADGGWKIIRSNGCSISKESCSRFIEKVRKKFEKVRFACTCERCLMLGKGAETEKGETPTGL